MKAAVLENNKFVIKEMPKPLLDEYGEGAVIKVSGCGLCGSDIVKMRTGMAKEGSVLGHEVVGEIAEINSNTVFQTGDKVVLGHHVPCFHCEYCRGGNYSMCRHFKSTNIFPGGFAEYIYVSEEHLNNTVFYANPNLTDIEASFLEPLGCCVRAVKRAGLYDGSKSLIVGLGSIGILMGQAVKAFEGEVYGCDLINERINLSYNYGFDKSFSSQKTEEAVKEIKKITSIGFDFVFLTAGASQSLDFALKAIRDGGTIVVFSSIKDENAYKNNDIYYRELKILGSYSPSPKDLETSKMLLDDGLVKVSGLSTLYNLENLNEAISDTISNKIMKAYIKI